MSNSTPTFNDVPRLLQEILNVLKGDVSSLEKNTQQAASEPVKQQASEQTAGSSTGRGRGRPRKDEAATQATSAVQKQVQEAKPAAKNDDDAVYALLHANVTKAMGYGVHVVKPKLLEIFAKYGVNSAKNANPADWPAINEDVEDLLNALENGDSDDDLV